MFSRPRLRRNRGHALLGCLLLVMLSAAMPTAAIEPAQLAVVVNLDDPQSRALGAYYRETRDLPREHLVEVRFKRGEAVMSEAEFRRVRAEVEARAPATTQAYALAWTLPYRAECMSITSAFAFGFDRALCADGCKPTRPSPLYRADTREPYTDLGIRPAMLLAARDLPQARALVERGVAADYSQPQGAAYLMSTSDKHRNVRAANYPVVEQLLQGRLKVHRLNQDALYGARDVMLYFTGLKDVKGLATLGFLPGAVADHLTSNGGVLKDSPQMSALAWITAGATASYGTVVEPCNFTQKFPDPVLLVDHYLAGETVLEAYWKSVGMPGQGVFIGEPLARPFATRAE